LLNGQGTARELTQRPLKHFCKALLVSKHFLAVVASLRDGCFVGSIFLAGVGAVLGHLTKVLPGAHLISTAKVGDIGKNNPKDRIIMALT